MSKFGRPLIQRTFLLPLAATLALSATAQDFRYQPHEQQIPPPACLTMHFPWEGGSTPCTPNTHEEWLKAVTSWRTERRIRVGYNGDRYAMPELQWTQSSFIQPQMMMHDRYFYDPVAGKYTVDRYLDDLEKRYGGIDAVLIWATYPNMGIDNRNQQDMVRSMPGFDAAGHGANHVLLIAIVDAHIWIGRPDEHRVDAAVTLLEIVEVAIDRVLAGDGVVEVAVVHHHLRLNEAGLGPLKRGHCIAIAVVADTDAALGTPVGHSFEPLLVSIRSAWRAAPFPGKVHGETGRRWNLLLVRLIAKILSRHGECERRCDGQHGGQSCAEVSSFAHRVSSPSPWLF